MNKDLFDGLTMFLAVAQTASFSLAAQKLDVSATAVSKAVRQMEDKFGVVLFQRTTRRVALTEAGQQLYQRLSPAVREVEEALAALGQFQQKPSGTLKLTMTQFVCELLIQPILPAFRSLYPDINLDIHIDEGMVDLLEEGFDAGVRLSESLEKDMVALPLTGDFQWRVVASPSYFKKVGKPTCLQDIANHTCVNYRFVSSKSLDRWEFVQDDRSVMVDPPVSLVVNSRSSLVNFVRQGLGLAYVAELEVKPWLDTGELEVCLSDFMPVTTGLYLYFPERTQNQPKLRALIDMLRKPPC